MLWSFVFAASTKHFQLATLAKKKASTLIFSLTIHGVQVHSMHDSWSKTIWTSVKAQIGRNAH